MCAKSCGLHQTKTYNSPAAPVLNAGTISNQLQPKSALGGAWSRPLPEPMSPVTNDINLNPRQSPGQQGGAQFMPNPGYDIVGGAQGPPQAEVAPPSPPSSLTAVQNFRAALLQRQAALSSSEPQYGRRLVVSRSSNGIARLMLPTQYNSRSLQRTVFTPRGNNFLHRDSYKTPQMRSGSNYDNNFGRFSSNVISSWQPRSNDQHSFSHTARPVHDRQYGGNIYDMSGYGAQTRSNRNNGGADGWLRNGINNGGFNTGSRDHPRSNNRVNMYHQSNNGDSNTWQKPQGTVPGHNPVSFSDFMNPEFGQVDAHLQRTGPSFMKSASPTQGYRYGRKRSSADQSHSLWDQVQQQAVPDRHNSPPSRRPQNHEPKRSQGNNRYPGQMGQWNHGNQFANNEPFMEPLSFINGQPIDQGPYATNRNLQAFTDPHQGAPIAITRETKRDYFNMNRIPAYTDTHHGGSNSFAIDPHPEYMDQMQMSNLVSSQNQYSTHPQQPPPPPPPPRALPPNTLDVTVQPSNFRSMLSFGHRYNVLHSHPNQAWNLQFIDGSSSSNSPSSSSSSSSVQSDINRTLVFPVQK